MMTPFKDKERNTLERKIYNKRHKSARSIIENAFGILKTKFLSLECMSVDVGKEADIERVSSWALACATLHNFLMMHPSDKLEDMPKNKFDRIYRQRARAEPYVNHSEKYDRIVGKERRERIVQICARHRPY
ncbi:hypothetical protein BGX26_007869 [Mortierella sp. AD094]|nr:hypothetical protein BGX26_007869 [Mortierella sp. AD094]